MTMTVDAINRFTAAGQMAIDRDAPGPQSDATNATGELLMLRIVPALLAVAAGWAAERESQTVLREREGDITSVYWDLRMDGPGVMPGLPPAWPSALVSAKVASALWTWEPNSVLGNPPGQPVVARSEKIEEHRTEYQVLARQSLWTPWPYDAALEVRAGMASRSFDAATTRETSADSLLSDPIISLLIPLRQERYDGAILSLGVSLPLGDEADWLAAHGKTGFVGGLRWSTLVPALPCVTVTASGEIQRVQNAEQVLYTDPTQPDITCDYERTNIGVRGTYRPTRWAAIGLSAGYEQHRWSGIHADSFSVTSNDTIDRYPVSLDLSIMAPRRTWWQVSVGYAGEMVYALQLTTNPW